MARTNTTSPLSILPFELQGQWFGLPLRMIEGVSPLPEVVAVPGNSSRVFLGLAYILGQIMSVVDCAPLCNLQSQQRARDVVVVHYKDAYYAVKVDSVGTILPNPKIQHLPKNQMLECAVSYTDQGKQQIRLLSIERIIDKYVCS